ncbi:hypothetical protein X946_3778 [Burkholderia sp. ABCPW 111]|nr:hypothetical protein X946_3778 [Burkholderia sp. ABCPW 111]
MPGRDAVARLLAAIRAEPCAVVFGERVEFAERAGIEQFPKPSDMDGGLGSLRLPFARTFFYSGKITHRIALRCASMAQSSFTRCSNESTTMLRVSWSTDRLREQFTGENKSCAI